MTTKKMLEKYSYDALQSKDSIRVLELQPASSHDAPLAARLIETEFSIPYDTISYVWGDPKDPEQLIIADDYYVSITRNLAQALRQFRDANECKILWADAVCIDQGNLQERGKQVAIMNEIYTKSVRTLGWLGNPENSKEIIRNLEHILKASNRDDETTPPPLRRRRNSAEEDAERAELAALFDSRTMSLLQEFITRQWFTRVWIVQEIVLSPNLHLFLGGSSIEFESFVTAIGVLEKFLDIRGRLLTPLRGHDGALTLIEAWKKFRAFIFPSGGMADHLPLGDQDIDVSLNDLNIKDELIPSTKGQEPEITRDDATGDVTVRLLSPKGLQMRGMGDPGRIFGGPVYCFIDVPQTLLSHIENLIQSGFQCTQKQDFVYGLLHLRNKAADVSLQPDYTKPVVEVYRDLAVAYLKRGHLRVLQLASPYRYVGDPKDPWYLPSWVPDWRRTSPGGSFMTPPGRITYTASTQLRPVVCVSPDEKTIKLRGCNIGQLAAVGYLQGTGSSSFAGMSPLAYRDYALHWVKTAILPLMGHFPELYPTREDVMVEFAEVITGNLRLQYKGSGNTSPDTMPAVRRKSLRETWTEFEARALDPDGDFSIACAAFEPADADAGLLHPIEDPQYAEIAMLFRNIIAALSFLRFGVLRDGHMGLFAAGTRIGDYVVVFNGAETPFVIRPCEVSAGGPEDGDIEGDKPEAGRFGLVGDCYVHGVMDGETLEAPYVERKKWYTLV